MSGPHPPAADRPSPTESTPQQQRRPAEPEPVAGATISRANHPGYGAAAGARSRPGGIGVTGPAGTGADPQVVGAGAAPTPVGRVDGVATVTSVADPEASAQTMPVAPATTAGLSSATATAAAAADAATEAAAAATAAAAAANAPQGPPTGTLYGSRETPDGIGASAAPSGRQPRLRIGWHTASAAALPHLGVASPGTGLILGADHDQVPVPIRFFRPEATRIALVGGVWAAQIVAFRALALGAQVVVMTADPAGWQGFGERAVNRADRVLVLHGEAPGTAIATPRQPVLVVHDLGTVGPSAPPPGGPWQTQLTVLRRLDERGVAAIQRCDLLMLQRLHPAEAAVAQGALRLVGQSTQLLQVMEDEMLALIGGGANRYLWLHPTAVERQFLGPPWR